MGLFYFTIPYSWVPHPQQLYIYNSIKHIFLTFIECLTTKIRIHLLDLYNINIPTLSM